MRIASRVFRLFVCFFCSVCNFLSYLQFFLALSYEWNGLWPATGFLWVGFFAYQIFFSSDLLCIPPHFSQTQQRIHMTRMTLLFFYFIFLFFHFFFPFIFWFFLKGIATMHILILKNLFLSGLQAITFIVLLPLPFSVLLSTTYKFFTSLHFLWQN